MSGDSVRSGRSRAWFMDDLCGVMAPIETNVVLGTAAITQPEHLLLHVSRQSPGLGVGDGHDEKFTISEPDKLGIAVRIGARRQIRSGVHRRTLLFAS